MAELEQHILNFYNKISAPYPLGIEQLEHGIRFAVETAFPNESGLILLGEGKEKKIAFCDAKRCGSISYGYYELKEEEQYDTYQIYEKNRRYLDEYVKQVQGNELWGGNKEPCLSGKLKIPFFAWEEEQSLAIPYEESVLYCLHVRGFTKHTSSGVKGKGTFRGMTEKIPYLKDLGITAVEIMPCYEFNEVQVEEMSQYSMEYMKQHLADEVAADKEEIKLNYWGYKKGYYFSPKESYSYSNDAVTEMKEMIQCFHQNGMEVIMQFYIPKETRPGFLLDVIKFWVTHYHIDGAHLLGEAIPIQLLVTEPLFSHIKLLFDQESPIPACMQEDGFRSVAFCQDEFMYTMRRYLKGDDDMLPTFLARMKDNPRDHAVINYMTNYSGFTLQDLVSYDKKHNERNGEDNRDGNDYNFSWNCGLEGTTRKKNIIKRRKKQVKNAMIFLLSAQGTPLILSGDEFLNSQNGNNNAYCQDNEIGWLNWNQQKKNQGFVNFVKELIMLRKNHPILHPPREFNIMDSNSCGYPDLSYHGEEAWRANLDNYNRHVGVMYCGKYAKTKEGLEDNFFYFAFNMHWMPHTFALPKLPGHYEWQLLVDTEKETGFLQEEDSDKKLDNQQKVSVEERTVKLYIGVYNKKR